VTDPEDSDIHGEDVDGHSNAADFDAATFDTEAEVSCPYCGEVVTVGLDPGSGAVQAYIEDCQVCCRPWRVHVRYDEWGSAQVWVEAGD
jgi:hypothetical protein